MVTSRHNDNDRTVFCGTVLNSKTGLKENLITAEEYIKVRQDEMTLIAQHKYGVRVSTDVKWREFIAHLGESAVAFEMLQTRSSGPVKVHFDASGGSSKGAAFILYNCARLETMIRTFNEKVSDGSYPDLPSLDNVDLSLLTDEDEWCIIFTYVMGVASLIRNTVDMNGVFEFRPHLICNFLSGMVKVFSQYYRRVRVLTVFYCAIARSDWLADDSRVRPNGRRAWPPAASRSPSVFLTSNLNTVTLRYRRTRNPGPEEGDPRRRNLRAAGELVLCRDSVM
ncbi:unnamed protein product [Danaus chrysippus]|uniref:(African queen) hypothetical protein n=1 Tax=Danaus chrysippus TaxID=151541 RepID=A0A8J2QGS1_9NEOP|nr:unnamed protein product [Danaus chrysippus]